MLDMTYGALKNLIRRVVWDLLHPIGSAQAQLVRDRASASGSGEPAGTSAPTVPAWVDAQESQRIISLGLGWAADDGTIVTVKNSKYFFVARGGEKFKAATLSSRYVLPDGYTNRLAVQVLDFKADLILATLCDLTLHAGDDRVQSGPVDFTFEAGQVVAVEVLTNSGWMDITVEIQCPVYSSPS